jgi:hypothetical protein
MEGAKMSNPEDNEFFAMKTIFGALEPLDAPARQRVISYVLARLGMSNASSASGHPNEPGDDVEDTTVEEAKAPKFQEFAELFDATQPDSNSSKALIAAYWLQVCQGSESFDAQTANTELKNLGHGIVNITNAIDALRTQKPALVLQLKKSGTSQQARKVYKVTVAGIKAVEAIIGS